jgi:HPt (histidine-containing phosphotransfer) domain-containing protein
MTEADPFAGVRARFRERLVDDRLVLTETQVYNLRDPEIVARVHRLAGLAGTLSYPQLSIRAKQLESLVSDGGSDSVQMDKARAEVLGEIELILSDIT